MGRVGGDGGGGGAAPHRCRFSATQLWKWRGTGGVPDSEPVPDARPWGELDGGVDQARRAGEEEEGGSKWERRKRGAKRCGARFAAGQQRSEWEAKELWWWW